jgi:hypothetical protein
MRAGVWCGTQRKETNAGTGECVVYRVGWLRGLNLFGSGNAQEVGWCEHGCEVSGCIKWGLGRVSSPAEELSAFH